MMSCSAIGCINRSSQSSSSEVSFHKIPSLKKVSLRQQWLTNIRREGPLPKVVYLFSSLWTILLQAWSSGRKFSFNVDVFSFSKIYYILLLHFVKNTSPLFKILNTHDFYDYFMLIFQTQNYFFLCRTGVIDQDTRFQMFQSWKYNLLLKKNEKNPRHWSSLKLSCVILPFFNSLFFILGYI